MFMRQEEGNRRCLCAGLVAQVNGHAASRPEIVARDGHHGASRLRPSGGVERQHRRVLWEEAET